MLQPQVPYNIVLNDKYLNLHLVIDLYFLGSLKDKNTRLNQGNCHWFAGICGSKIFIYLLIIMNFKYTFTSFKKQNKNKTTFHCEIIEQSVSFRYLTVSTF